MENRIVSEGHWFSKSGIITVAFLLSACIQKDSISVTEVRDPTTKQVVSTTTEYQGKSAINVKSDEGLHDAHVKQRQAFKEMVVGAKSDAAQVAMVGFEKLAPTQSLGMDSRTYNLQVKKENTNRLNILAQLVPFAYQLFNSGERDRGRAGIVVNGDGNEIRSNTGDDAIFTYTDSDATEIVPPFGGIPVNPLTFSEQVITQPMTVPVEDNGDGTVTDANGDTCSAGTAAENGGLCI